MRLYFMMRSGTIRGITLIELMVVMALLSMATLLVGPAVGSGVDNLLLHSTGRQLVSAFRLAQTEAKLEQQELVAVVNGGQFLFLKDSRTVRVVTLPTSIEVLPSPDTPTYIFLGSGQILGPARLELLNRRGRRGVLMLGPAPGAIQFREERP